jgi:hypothetical protein
MFNEANYHPRHASHGSQATVETSARPQILQFYSIVKEHLLMEWAGFEPACN